jgi:hypothetical protein
MQRAQRRVDLVLVVLDRDFVETEQAVEALAELQRQPALTQLEESSGSGRRMRP